MQKVRVPQNSFQFGEVSDSLIMRTDSPVYGASAQRVENMIVTAEGALKKRYGLKNLHNYDLTYDANHPAQSHLFKFVFDDNEEYVISIEHQKLRCFQLETSGAVTLVSTITQDTDSNTLPFDQDYLQEYTTAQYGDVMFICHPLFAPRMLIRTSLTDFEITPYSFDQRADNKVTYQPYSKFQSSGVTLDPSATTGTGVTFTTSSDYWDITGTQTSGDYLDSTHVGVIIRYGEAEIEITSVQSATQATGNIVDELKRRLSVLNPLRTIAGSSTVEVTMFDHGFSGGESITIEDSSAVGGINTGNINGTRTVGDIIDENTFTFTAGGSASDSEDGGGYVKIVSHAPTRDWSEQSWSAKRGYPAAVVFHENRLCFGGTLAEPDAIWMSKIGSFFNFDLGIANDNESISLVAATGDVNQIRYMISNRDLQVFTATGELYIPTYLNQAITPTNAQVRKQTPYGTEFVQPASIDGATIFVQTGGRIVREYLYTDSEDAYTSTAISTIASHLIDSPKCMAVVHSGFGLADSYAALTLSNGDLALFSSNRAEKRAAWTRVTTNGNFCSVVAIHDRLFANVWYNNKLHLCEFDSNIFVDNYKVFELEGLGGILDGGEYTGVANENTLNEYNTGDPTGSWYYPTGTYQSNWGYGGSSGVAFYMDKLFAQTYPNEVFYLAEYPLYQGIKYRMRYFITQQYREDIKYQILDADDDSVVYDGNTASWPNTLDETFVLPRDVQRPKIQFSIEGEAPGGLFYVQFGGIRIQNTFALNLSANFAPNSELYLFNASDDSLIGPVTLDENAEIDLSEYEGMTIAIGESFTSKVITNPVDASLGNGPATGEVRGITNVVVDVKETSSMTVNSRPAISSSFTGKKEVRLLGYDRNPQVTIEQDEPSLIQVNGIVAELVV